MVRWFNFILQSVKVNGLTVLEYLVFINSFCKSFFFPLILDGLFPGENYYYYALLIVKVYNEALTVMLQSTFKIYLSLLLFSISCSLRTSRPVIFLLLCSL